MTELPDCYRCGCHPCQCKDGISLYAGDCVDVLARLPEASVHCCVTSPPYWGLRDYGIDGQLGLEPKPEEYVTKMVSVFREVRRVLRSDGTCWVNMGDSYNAAAGPRKPTQTGKHGYWENPAIDKRIDFPGLKPKDLCGVPWRVAFALQADGWYLRSDIIWSKPNPMPESVTDRPTKAHEYLFLLTKQPRYYFDADAIREDAVHAGEERAFNTTKKIGRCIGREPSGNEHPDALPWTIPAGRNRRTVWTIPTQPYPSAHFATFPTALVEPCIMAGTSEKGCCPECGKPWVRVVEKVRRATRPGEKSKVYKTPDGWDTSIGEGGHGSFHKDGREEGTTDYENRHQRDAAEIGNRDPGRHVTEFTTLGWRPDCECGGAYAGGKHGHSMPIPCTVLDPFAGSGTTLQVARWLGRHAIGIELSPEYCELAKRRIIQPRERPPIVRPLPGQLDLFSTEHPA